MDCEYSSKKEHHIAVENGEVIESVRNTINKTLKNLKEK